MAGLYFPPDQLHGIAAAVVAGYPRECCGALVGSRVFISASEAVLAEETHREVVQVVPLNNSWQPSRLEETDPQGNGGRGHSDRDRYWIDPVDLLAVQKSARAQELEIVGIYHSHPDHSAVPSECDRRLAWPVYSYVIVSVMAGQVADIKSWRLNDLHQFAPEPVKMIGTSANKPPFLS